MTQTEGRTNFLARVAGNSLDIVLRDHQLGDAARTAELRRLRNFFDDADGDLNELRARMVAGLRNGAIALDAPGLADHLRASAVNQLAIDQPRYPGLQIALDYAAP